MAGATFKTTFDKDRNMKALIYGVGINDETSTYGNAGKNKARCPFYIKWKSMLERCYSERFQLTHPTYKDCTVCDEWLKLSSFKSWMKSKDWEGKQLDKDIIIPGNKIYSPETCCFVTHAVNNLINTACKSSGKYKPGVNFIKRDKKFHARVSVNGKLTHLGSYSSEEEATCAYKTAKKKLLLDAAKEQLDEEVKLALENRAELI